MDNSLELKVSLRVNDSMSDLRTQLTQIEGKLRNVKLKATLDIGDSQKIIDQRIDKLSNSVKKLQLTAGLNYADSKVNIEKTVNRLNKGLNVEATLKTKVDNTSLSQTANKVKKATKSVGDVEFNVKDFQNKMAIAVKQLQQSKSHSFKNGELEGFLKSVNELTATTPNLNKRMTELRTQLRGVAVEAKQVESSLGTAIKGMTLWSATATMVYFPIRTAREFGSIIVDLDTKMTELKKVMSSDTDFNAIFEQATASATKFGQSISEAMDSYIEFSKQGFSGNDLQKLADSALVASNVADISAQQASSYLTSSLIQWNKTANESMGIIDSWNNISNQFA